jgi:hypothetical protein
MRRVDEQPIDPDVAAQLDAIDATLAGDPVAPEYAELAELALLLAAGRPKIDAGFARSLDQRVQHRFRPPAREASAAGATAGTGAEGAGRRRWRLSPALGAGAAAGLAAIVAIVIVSSGPSGSSSGSGAVRSAAPSAVVRSAASSAASSSTASTASPVPPASPAPTSPAALVAGGTGGGVVLQPPSNGRKITQSAQLALTAPPTRIDQVAQEVFNVIGTENGVVNNSNVTATGGADGSAQFQLSVPSSVLPQTMAALSRLRYATVASRTDTSQDVNNQFVSDTRRLADAQALRTGLLKQLANAATQQQIDSLGAQIRDAEASIASAQAALSGLNHQINFSQISLTVAAGSQPVPVAHGGGSFTLGRALHDAGRVLTVAAGAALISLAALLPLALLAAVAGWVASQVRRRRREQALDLA